MHVNSARLNYFRENYIFPNVLRMGWYLTQTPDPAAMQQEAGLHITPVGFADQRLGFLVTAGGNGQYHVKDLYIAIRAYAPCDLRDEYVTMAAFTGAYSYSLYISEDYEIYPLYPKAEGLTDAS